MPTVVYGYFALLFVTPLLQKLIPALPGFNMLSAGLVIGIMIIPYVSLAQRGRDARGADAHARRLATRWARRACRRRSRVVVPAALSGITAAYILGISRAVGETMVVAIAAGMQPNLTLESRPSRRRRSPRTSCRSSLGDLPHGSIGYQSIFAAGLALMLMTLVFNIGGLLAAPTLPGGVLMARATARIARRIRAMIARRKLLRRDRSSCVGLLVADASALLTLAALFVDLVQRRRGRGCDRDFLTQFPVAQAREPGRHPVGLGRHLADHAGDGRASRCRSASRPAIYLEEYAPKNWFTAVIEINVTNLAGVPSIIYGLLALGLFVYQFGLGQSILDRRV